MRTLLAVFVLTFCATVCVQAQQDVKVSLQTPKMSVQYIVIDLAKQAGLGYNWDKSFKQTDPECRRFVQNVAIKDQPFDKAMAQILKPVRLEYRVEDNKVVLYRR